MRFKDTVHYYFTEYLQNIKGVSPETIKTYKESFGLFLKFSSKHLSKNISDLEFEDISSALIFSFLDYLEKDRKNSIRTRNARLIALKSFAKMLRLLYPEHRQLSEIITFIPQKRFDKRLIGYMDYDDLLKVFNAVDLKKKEGIRDYTILHLLFDSGARASEVANLKMQFFNPDKGTLIIKGKGGKYRLIELQTKTTEMINCYIEKNRPDPNPIYINYLFVNQRRENMTRGGIYRLCKKYLSKALSEKQLANLNPVHSFRHSCAVHLLISGKSLTDIKNHLGHENLESTMTYLHLNVSRKREAQNEFLKHIRSTIPEDNKMDDLLNWERKDEILDWLDSL
ncbi:MAG: tyrosine-type recombinase/integrase [Desulfobacteraceae bacterium]|nr:tyrosine-type recombinase/integrase [Desulfobacteraceae bacterium]